MALNETPATAAMKRRIAGKREWKAVIDEVLQSEREDLEDLRTLKRRITDPESLRIIGELFARKSERVIALTQLYHYRDRDVNEVEQ